MNEIYLPKIRGSYEENRVIRIIKMTQWSHTVLKSGISSHMFHNRDVTAQQGTQEFP